MSNVKPIPDGYHSVTPYLFIRGAGGAIDFYKKVFDAKEVMRVPGPIGQVMHAEIKIGDSIIMLADENPKIGAMSPQTAGGISVSLHDSGAKLLRPVQNQIYGDRSGTLIDPFGHMWSVSTHVEDVSPEELKRRMDAASSHAAHG